MTTHRDTKNKVSKSWLSKVSTRTRKKKNRDTQTQTDATECSTMPRSRAVNRKKTSATWRTVEDDVSGAIKQVVMVVVKNNDLAEVEHFTRERTADHRAVAVLNVYVVHTELVWGPAHCPPRREVTSSLTRY